MFRRSLEYTDDLVGAAFAGEGTGDTLPGAGDALPEGTAGAAGVVILVANMVLMGLEYAKSMRSEVVLQGGEAVRTGASSENRSTLYTFRDRRDACSIQPQQGDRNPELNIRRGPDTEACILAVICVGISHAL